VYILDTDTATLWLRYAAQYPRLRKKIEAAPFEQIWVSIVTVTELMRGALAYLKKREQKGEFVLGFELAAAIITDIKKLQILPFDEAAKSVYRAMPANVKRVGAKDCQIAAIAIANGFTVVTRNVRDFQRIPDVKFADWTT